ncbi:MAG: nitrilase-related carbon-nitrogen hydrolase [Deferrisomatales bacterium]|nr:nitrilase-related carbon-nitrogen hydrolase [Deferrisomatales bacterium]
MVRVAAIQVAASGDPERNLRKASQYLEVAAGRGVEVACLPELFCLPWFPRGADDATALAQAAEGPLATELAALAGRLGLAVVCPFYERAADGVCYNSALLIDAKGAAVGLYRKAHVPLLPYWEEKRHFAPGDLGFPVFPLGGLQVGIQLGWDNFFPEGFRCLALGGAGLVFLPTAAAFASQERWLALAVGHAVANGVYVVRVNRVGSEGGLDFYGQSFVVRPDGELAVEPLGMGEGILVAECDPDVVDRTRKVWPFLRDRRPRQYARVAGIEWGPGLLPPAEDGQAGFPA